MLVVGIVYLVATLIADIAYAAAQPAHPLRERAMSAPTSRSSSASTTSRRRQARRTERGDRSRGASGCASSCAPRPSSSGAVIVAFWILCAIFGYMIVPDDPFATELARQAQGAVERALVRHRSARPRRLLPGHRRRPRASSIVAPLATVLGTVLGTALGLVTGYFRGVVDDVLMRIVDAFLALPVVIIGAARASSRSGRRASP